MSPRQFYALAVSVPLLGMLVFGLLSVDRFADLSRVVFDSYQRTMPRVYDPGLPVRIAAVDEKSIKRFGQWPWPRAVLARLVERLNEAGVAAIGFDIVFAEAEREKGAELLESLPEGPGRSALQEALKSIRTGDEAFAQALGGGRVVLGTALGADGSDEPVPTHFGIATAGDDPLSFLANFNKAVIPLPVFSEVAAGVGSVNWLPDRDQTVRRVPIVVRKGDQIIPGLAAECLRVAQEASTFVLRASNASGQSGFGARTGMNAVRIGGVEVATDAQGEIRIAFTKTDARRFLSVSDIVDGKVDRAALEGAIVFVGMTAAGLLDQRATPIDSAVPGVEIHAQLMEHILTGSSLSRPDWAAGAELVAALLLALLIIFALPRMGAKGGAILVLGLAALVVGGSILAYARAHILIDPVYPGLTAAVVAAVAIAVLYGQEERQRRAIRDAFGRYLSPAMVERLASDPSKLTLGGELRDITVLFCDLRGFTSISERMDAPALARFMNAYLTGMTDAILDAGGTLDKYVGDAVIAFWNAPLADPNHAPHAIDAVAGMRRALRAFNEKLAVDQPGTPEVRFGIGLATGPCSVGNFGSNRRFDYSAFGDDVNVAARLEQGTKSFGLDVLVADSTRQAAPDKAWVAIGPVKVKGKAEPFMVHTVLPEDGWDTTKRAELAALHDALIAAWTGGRREEALARLAEAAAIAPPTFAELYRRYAKVLSAESAMVAFDLTY